MTLTSILPTLRRSIPGPFSRDAWPARAEPTCDDVIVGGVSVARYVDLCATPCVMTGPAVIPLSGGMPSPTDTTTVLAIRVAAVSGPDVGDPDVGGPDVGGPDAGDPEAGDPDVGRDALSAAGPDRSRAEVRLPVLRIDATLAGLAPRWNEVRLIGRISRAADHRFAVADCVGERVLGVAALLPSDLAAGDVLVVPCAGAHSVGEVRPQCAPGMAAAAGAGAGAAARPWGRSS